MEDLGLFTLPFILGNSKPFDTLADLGSCVSIILLYLFKKLNIALLEETDHIFRLADVTKSYPLGIVKDVKVRIGKLKLLNDFYVIDMKKDPQTPLLVGSGLATANTVIDCRKAKIAIEEGITKSVFGVKEVDFGEEEAPYWTTLGKRKSYKPRPSSDGIGEEITTAFVYVDDMLITSNYEFEVKALKQSLDQKFTIKGLGLAKYFLGIELCNIRDIWSCLMIRRANHADKIWFLSDNMPDGCSINVRIVSSWTQNAEIILGNIDQQRRLCNRTCMVIKKLAERVIEGKIITGTHTVGHEAAYGMSWKTLMKMMTEKYCPRNEIRKLEMELWDLKCSGKPKTMQEAIDIATELMDKKIRTFAERETASKRKFENTSRNTQNQQPQHSNKRQNTGRVYTATSGEKKQYGDLGQRPACYECGVQGHFKRECPK
nr:hypothetical protein [Tanacetum cinerariifolium]